MSSRIVPILGLAVILGLVLIALQVGSGTSDIERSPGVAADAATPESVLEAPSGPDSTVPEAAPEVAIPVLGPAPSLEDLDGWLQSDITSLDELRGSVVVLQFWTFGCYNCKNTIPHLQALAATHAGDDFSIVGVHAPEFAFEEDPVAIQAAADELGVTWPIALDTDQVNFFGWQGSPAYWPRTYVIDREGNLRFDHIGEGAYDELGEVVATLLEST